MEKRSLQGAAWGLAMLAGMMAAPGSANAAGDIATDLAMPVDGGTPAIADATNMGINGKNGADAITALSSGGGDIAASPDGVAQIGNAMQLAQTGDPASASASSSASSPARRNAPVALSRPVAMPAPVTIPAGWFYQGSDKIEREYAYRIDEQIYGNDVTRRNRWYDSEQDKWRIYLPSFVMMATPVTNDQYAVFVRETGHAAPDVTRENWESFGLIYGYDATRPFAWKDGQPPSGKGDHPVVLVSWQDAMDYAAWLSQKTGQNWHLPPEDYWEKAMRGPDGIFFPWGNIYEPDQLNSADHGPFETTAVAKYAPGPYGMYDGAGQVFEWTSTVSQPGYRIVKGGSWDDRGCGVCRPAARHGRPEHLQHILVGFRLMHDENPS